MCFPPLPYQVEFAALIIGGGRAGKPLYVFRSGVLGYNTGPVPSTRLDSTRSPESKWVFFSKSLFLLWWWLLWSHFHSFPLTALS